MPFYAATAYSTDRQKRKKFWMILQYILMHNLYFRPRVCILHFMYFIMYVAYVYELCKYVSHCTTVTTANSLYTTAFLNYCWSAVLKHAHFLLLPQF